jgi:hypothetical protein
MLLYNYDGITKEYLYSIQANIDELESINKGQTVYIIPANCTDRRPQNAREGFAQCFDENSNNRFFIEDHRGKTVYSKEDLSPLEIVTLGAIPNGYIEDIPKPKNKYQIWENGKYVYPELNELKSIVKQDLDEKYEMKIETPYKVGEYYIQPTWATIYTNTLVAMQEDVDADGRLDNVYRILLILDPLNGAFHHLEVKSIDEFMPFYKKVKEKYKEITEDYHDKIIRIAKANDPEVIVSIILTY